MFNRLEDRRVREDLIEMYKSVNGLDEINWERNQVIDTFKSEIRNDFAKLLYTMHNYFINRITPT